MEKWGKKGLGWLYKYQLRMRFCIYDVLGMDFNMANYLEYYKNRITIINKIADKS